MKVKPIIILALSLFASSNVTAQTTVEIDGVYYKLNGSIAEVSLPDDDPNFQYSGSLTIPSKVTYQSTEYPVNSQISTALRNSAVTELIVGEGFEQFNASLYNDEALECIRFNTTDLKPENEYYASGTINVGNHPGCAYVTHWVDGDKAVVHVEKFNVYGPDGQKLQPYLGIADGAGGLIEPDSDGNFILDADYYYNGDYCGVLKLDTAYWIVLLYCKVGENGLMCIRCHPRPDQTGINTTIDGLNYMIAPQYAVVDTPAEGQTYSGEVSVPEKITYEGKELPVTKINASAFALSEITSITLPSSITAIGLAAFNYCTQLTKADLSACDNIVKIGNSTFYDCWNLTDVSLPENLTEIPSQMFSYCRSLESLDLSTNVKHIGYRAFSYCESFKTFAVNQGTEISGAFYDCPSLLKTDIIENSEEKVRIKVESNITTTDGEPLIPSAFFYYMDDSYDPPYIITEFQPQDGIFTIIRSDDTFLGATGAFYLYFFGNNSDGTYLPTVASHLYSEPCYFSRIDIPGPGQLGVSDDMADTEAEAEFYNLQGVRVGSSDLCPGIYIKRQGSKTSKMLVR